MRPLQIRVKQTQNLPDMSTDVNLRVLRDLALHSLDSDT